MSKQMGEIMAELNSYFIILACLMYEWDCEGRIKVTAIAIASNNVPSRITERRFKSLTIEG